MKFFFDTCGLEADIKECGMTGISIENPVMFRRLTESLWNQSNGLNGELYITCKDKAIKLNKDVCVIFNPYSIDVNEKKIINRIYSEMNDITEQEYMVRKADINSSIVTLLDEISEHLPYPLEYSLDLDFQQLLKLYGVRIEMKDIELAERIVDYIRIAHQVLGISVFIFVHFRDYFSNEEIRGFEEMASYEQVSLIMIENRVELTGNEDEKWWIIDKDSCIIEI